MIGFRDRVLLAVRVYPSPSRPHFIKRTGRRSGTHVRVGSTNRQADAQLIAEMQRFASGEAFDEWPMPEVNSEAIDFRAPSREIGVGRGSIAASSTGRCANSAARDDGPVVVVIQAMRHAADYDPDTRFSKSDVAAVLARVNRAIRDLEGATPAEKRALAIHVLIRAWSV